MVLYAITCALLIVWLLECGHLRQAFHFRFSSAPGVLRWQRERFMLLWSLSWATG
jgi:hypothetical protein